MNMQLFMKLCLIYKELDKYLLGNFLRRNGQLKGKITKVNNKSIELNNEQMKFQKESLLDPNKGYSLDNPIPNLESFLLTKKNESNNLLRHELEEYNELKKSLRKSQV